MAKLIDNIFNFFGFILDLAGPPKCIVCDRAIGKPLGLCPDCVKIFEKAERKRCGICLKQPKNCFCRPMLLSKTDPIGDRRLISLLFLAPSQSKKPEDILSRKFIYHIKRNSVRTGVPFAARELSFEILKLIKTENLNSEDWIITNPPRSKKQIILYDFDHAEELARKISEYTGVRYMPCLKRKTNKMQKTLNAFERRANADKAYVINPEASLQGKNVFIVDDVITTGATINACAAILKENGAQLVFPICIARTKKRPRKARRPLNRNTWFTKKESPQR